jgi:RNA polymerase sigma-70 factor (ECF subfamily)
LAEEVAHDAFVIAARGIHRFDPGRATLRAWLLGIAKNRYMSIQAGENRRKRHEQSSAKAGSGAVTPPKADLHVHEALARLPSRYRVVLEAKYLRGLTMKEIAADDGVSIEAIESLLRRARASFADTYRQIQTFT